MQIRKSSITSPIACALIDCQKQYLGVPYWTLFCPNIDPQIPIKRLTPYRHFHLIERVLGHIIGIYLVYFSYDKIHIRLMWLGKQQKFRAANGLKARQAEKRGFKNLDAGALRRGKRQHGWRQ